MLVISNDNESLVPEKYHILIASFNSNSEITTPYGCSPQ